MRPVRKPRRLTFSMVAWTAVMSRSCGGRLDGGGDELIAAAAADVAAHRTVDIFFGGVLVGRQQCCGLHDLASLAIAALWDIQCTPRLLYRMISVRVEPLDGYHRAAADIVYGGDAGAGGFAVDMDGAGSAQRDPTAVFRSDDPELVPKIPGERRRWIAIE